MNSVPSTNPTNPTCIREEEIMVTIIEGDNNPNIDHVIEIGIMIDQTTDKLQGETTSEVATELTIAERGQFRSPAREKF